MENLGYVYASKFLVDNRLPVTFMYREEGEGDDSGWRFFSGLETQEYMDDPDNVGIYDVETILKISGNGCIRELLQTPAPCAFEREQVDQPFTASADFAFGEEE